MTARSEVRRELEALRRGRERRKAEARGRPFLAPDLDLMRERIAHLEQALRAGVGSPRAAKVLP